MTTIVYRSGRLAADTGVSNGGLAICGSKLLRVPSGIIYGFAGHYVSINKLRDWLQNPTKNKPNLHDDLWGLKIDSASIQMLSPPHADFTTINPRYGYLAIGSGAQYAYGAMARGATASEAVLAAMMFDPSTFGDVETLDLHTSEAA